MARSELHDTLTARAKTWLQGRAGFSGIKWAYELTVAPAYIVDAAAVCHLQGRFVRELRGLAAAPLPGHLNYFAHVFETKVTRADFLARFHPNKPSNRATPVANLHYLVTPKGLVSPEELYPFWGLLEASGCGLRVVRQARPEGLGNYREIHGDFAEGILWKQEREY